MKLFKKIIDHKGEVCEWISNFIQHIYHGFNYLRISIFNVSGDVLVPVKTTDGSVSWKPQMCSEIDFALKFHGCLDIIPADARVNYQRNELINLPARGLECAGDWTVLYDIEWWNGQEVSTYFSWATYVMWKSC